MELTQLLAMDKSRAVLLLLLFLTSKLQCIEHTAEHLT